MLGHPQRRFFRALCLAGLAAATLLVLAACGGDGGPEATPGPRAVTIYAGDTFFQPNEVAVIGGRQATFRVVNGGPVFIHNMRIAGADNVFGTEDDAVSVPDAIGPRREGRLVWQVPAQRGIVNFRCDFHPDQMTGTIFVQWSPEPTEAPLTPQPTPSPEA